MPSSSSRPTGYESRSQYQSGPSWSMRKSRSSAAVSGWPEQPPFGGAEGDAVATTLHVDGWGPGVVEAPPPPSPEQPASASTTKPASQTAHVRRSIDRSISGVTSLAFTWFRVLAHHGPMRRAVDAREHLDGELDDASTLDGNLADLARINRLFGGTRLSIAALRRLVVAAGADGEALRVIDVGTGGADIPLALATATGPWSSVAVTAVDSRREVLAAAERLNARLASHPGVSLALADGRELPWPDGAFDVGHASLVLHHLERREAVRFLAELGRVARLGVVVNDLARGRLTLLGARVLLPLMTRNAWTRHDGVLSVRRAWTRREAEELLREARLRPIGAAVGFAAHRWAIAAVPA